MAKLTLKGKDLRSIGYPQGPAVSVAIGVMEQYYKHHSTEAALDILKSILEDPLKYKDNAHLDKIVQALLPKEQDAVTDIVLNQTGVPVSLFGKEHMEGMALHQIELASRLPVVVAAALMPDAHSGYGLPIGGVLATDNAVIPYGVGVDIGCRMSLSIFDIPVKDFYRRESIFTRALEESTLFGSGARFNRPEDHPVMERREFYELPLLNKLRDRAWQQLGTSGSGNHFAEFGVVNISEADPVLGVPPGSYVGLLSHSGSRGLGAGIADHYTRIAKQKRRLPGEASNLAWLTLDEAEGMEYWISMNLAGDYARACHEVIHGRIAWELSRKPIAVVENHHNFAWKEKHGDREWIVHRKGATPAGQGVPGIIPGSMTARGFIVKGKGMAASISSAAHGAGRKMSRSVAAKSITRHAMKEELSRHGVRLLGGGLDEAPFAYKDIEAVMKSQQSLVDVLGTFTPKIVRMDKNTGRG
jgi:tRNA-splicing ligase RtcB